MDAASCCACAAPKVKDLTAAPDLRCEPCMAGRAPASNGSACEPCPPGEYARPGQAQCTPCGEGSSPLADRSSCMACESGKFSPGHVDTCESCQLPLILYRNQCIWWYLPLSAVAVACFLAAVRFATTSLDKAKARRLARKAAKVDEALAMLYQELWEELPDTINRYSAMLQNLGYDVAKLPKEIAGMRAQQSERAGVSMRYLLSEDFAELAAARTRKADPTFTDMKAFWLGDDPIGRNVICPRDGRPGCAMVDWIPRADRKQQTHFMSWTWQYTLTQVRSALNMYCASAKPAAAGAVFFFMCFFVNNQFRIVVEKSTAGSDNLESVFGDNLKRIGQMVAILDTLEQPVYLKRVWTVYEQFVASTLEIPVAFIMPESSAVSARKQIFRGEVGINEITDSVSRVDSAAAKAWDPKDEQKVKALIQSTVGFNHVDAHVTDVMVRWIGELVRQEFRELIARGRDRRTRQHGEVYVQSHDAE